MEVNDYSFKILEKILMLKQYNNREEVVKVAETMLNIANSKNISNDLKFSYEEALNKINKLSFDEMKEIINILSSEDEEEDDDDEESDNA